MNYRLVVVSLVCVTVFAAPAAAKIPSTACEKAEDESDKVTIEEDRQIILYNQDAVLIQPYKPAVTVALQAYGVTETNYILIKAEEFFENAQVPSSLAERISKKASGKCLLLQNMNVKYGKRCEQRLAGVDATGPAEQNKMVGTNQFGATLCKNPQPQS